MRTRQHNQGCRPRTRAQSLTEFMALMIFVLAALLIFQKYIVRGFSGRWKGAGDAFGYGRQYDPKKTVECAFDQQYDLGWYDVSKYEDNACDVDCLSGVSGNEDGCKACILLSVTAECSN